MCANSEILPISVTLAAGLPIDSQNINLVLESIFFSRASRSFTSPNLVSMPILGKVSLKRLTVPPYSELVETILSPFVVIFNIAAEIAAIPDANARPPIPFSIAATRSSSTSVVGFPILVYILPFTLRSNRSAPC